MQKTANRKTKPLLLKTASKTNKKAGERMDFASVDAYLQQLNNTQVYTDLDQATKEKAVFSAIEALKDVYRESLLNDRIAAIQTLYMLEGMTRNTPN